MEPAFETLFAELDACATSIPSVQLQKWIKQCPLRLADVLSYCRYHPDHYVRNLMHAGPVYHALVLPMTGSRWKNYSPAAASTFPQPGRGCHD